MIDASSFRRLTDVLDVLVSPTTGPILFVREMPRPPNSPDFCQFAAYAQDNKGMGFAENFRSGGGASPYRGRALAKAVGESLERYGGAIFEIDDFPSTSFDAAPFACALPESFALYSETQYAEPDFPFRRFDRQTVTRWCPAVRYADQEIVHIPACTVFVPWFYIEDGDTPLLQPISTGLAFHCSYQEAAISAICEVIERDAFTITWQAMISPPRIVGDLGPDNTDLVARLERGGYATALFDITLDHGVPTVMAIARRSRPSAPPVVVAAATSPDPIEAARKALEETAHTGSWMEAKMRDGAHIDVVPGYTNIREQNDHLIFYCDPDNAGILDFLQASERTTTLSGMTCIQRASASDTLEELALRVQAFGEELYLVDLTPPDLRQLGLAVVRAVIPGCQRLAAGHWIRPLGGRRLWKVPQKMGYAGIMSSTGDNPAPHPYP
ncbi:YcaO-like family protein [Sphingomonas sp.]|jgi:ribosomal protein S12 methylthiotransferase accessory factor|uniref:YcaO-like family protein n=1 Tax=Sphingomonas sp. TaxID=28214 RepID=UPI002E327012|nr:YcaO-like family protein [Sphingomonas sp.]HEX4694654.1 YcaO-like family protein [Sphingomonas sp.]